MPDEIIADVDELIETLEENRNAHRKTFLKAQEKYREHVIKALDDALAKARKHQGSLHSLVLAIAQLPEPEDHTSDYDREIRMLRMHTEPKIEVNRHEAEQYIMDNWAWSHAFAGTAQAYGVR